MEVANKDLVYLYCVTAKTPKMKDVADLADRLHFVFHDGLYAVVSRVSRSEFGEESLRNNLADLEWIKAKANMHERIVEGIMKNACIVPLKFATLFNTEDSLKACLERHGQAFKENLACLVGTEEWGVKIYCRTETLRVFLGRDEETVSNMEREIGSSSPGKAFLLTKKKEELLDSLISAKLNEYGQRSFEKLEKQSRCACINKLLPKEVTERTDDMILNSAFLVEKAELSDFRSALDALRAQYEDRGISFDCTGPWPPYNFCVSIRKDGPVKEGAKNG